ncbi:zinc finger BED domain-containing protein RICESLEEPER 2-like [Dendrobium catenatum]|uniref:zinc finger BED domain-containing protein RICESLEEPER 2-like n=1 Tax=Dendrobium catenatum TaxID=906689 RepID=UPI00109F0D7C|nr:zinc finger BED domain-containing protein RICESLEEPER 2-like [Dendrobium catenatum]
MVKDGIKSIEFVVEKIRDTVSFLNASEGRLLRFADVVHQLHLPTRKLIMDCPTRWNSTYNMLTVALQLREAFTSYSEREVTYHNSPMEDEWTKIEKVCDVLGYFNEATNIISGTEYPTSNLFLSHICTIKKVLDDSSISSDDFVRHMTMKMKEKFDKYWGECNLLMAFEYVRNFEDEAKGACETFRLRKGSTQGGSHSLSTSHEGGSNKYSGWLDFTAFVSEKTSKKPAKSDLDNYLEDGLEICPPGKTFDVIRWWKSNQAKYLVLSRLAVEILAIPINMVASESTFSASERVVDTYRSKLGIETVQALICGSNWEEEDDDEIEIPIPCVTLSSFYTTSSSLFKLGSDPLATFRRTAWEHYVGSALSLEVKLGIFTHAVKMSSISTVVFADVMYLFLPPVVFFCDESVDGLAGRLPFYIRLQLLKANMDVILSSADGDVYFV